MAVPDADIATLPLRTPFSVGAVNCYLLLGAPLTLVDAGPHSQDALEDLETGLAARNVAVEDLELILLTHQHIDHVGLAATLQRRSGCRVAAHELLASHLSDLVASQEAETAYQAEIMRLHGAPGEVIATLREVDGAFRRFAESVEVTRSLGDGEEIIAAGRRLVCRLRPGHSPTDTIFVDAHDRIALVGDHLIETISSNPVVHRPITGPADPRDRASTLGAYRSSLLATAEEEYSVLYPGHRGLIRSHRSLINRRFMEQSARNEDVLTRFVAGSTTAYAVAREIWPDVPLRQAYLILSEVLGACDMLVADGKLEQVKGSEITYRMT